MNASMTFKPDQTPQGKLDSGNNDSNKKYEDSSDGAININASKAADASVHSARDAKNDPQDEVPKQVTNNNSSSSPAAT